MEILKFAVPAVTGMLGLAKLLDEKIKYFKLLTTVLIILGGAGSAVMVQLSGRADAAKARAAEAAQQRAEEKLDRMSAALLDIQQDLAELQVALVRGAQSPAGAAAASNALKTTIGKLTTAKQLMEGTPATRPDSEAAPAPDKPADAKPAVRAGSEPAGGSAVDGD